MKTGYSAIFTFWIFILLQLANLDLVFGLKCYGCSTENDGDECKSHAGQEKFMENCQKDHARRFFETEATYIEAFLQEMGGSELLKEAKEYVNAYKNHVLQAQGNNTRWKMRGNKMQNSCLTVITSDGHSKRVVRGCNDARLSCDKIIHSQGHSEEVSFCMVCYKDLCNGDVVHKLHHLRNSSPPSALSLSILTFPLVLCLTRIIINKIIYF